MSNGQPTPSQAKPMSQEDTKPYDIKHWEYARGEWTKLPFSPWEDLKETNYEEMLRAVGYEAWGNVGEEDSCPSTAIQVYRAEKSTPTTEKWTYFVCLSMGPSVFEEVWVKDLPSLLQFLREFGPVFQTQSREEVVSFLKETLTKAFRVWHGHDATFACQDCDPLRYREEQKRRLARLQAKKTANSPPLKGAL